MTISKEIIKIEKNIVKPDLFGQLDQLNKKYEEKFLNDIHPLIKKYHDFTGKEFKFQIPDKVIIQYNGGHYWVLEGSLFNGEKNSGIWFEKEGCDVYGRKFGGEKNGWFYLTARLCYK